MSPERVHVVDSHTEGEPTRVVVSGGPDLIGDREHAGVTGVVHQLGVFRERFDWFRSAIVNEPRGSEALVGCLLCPPASARAVAGVIFFNNVGFLSACGHGTIGVARTLAHLGRIGAGEHVLETPVGDVTVRVRGTASSDLIEIENVPSYRLASGVELAIDREFGGRVSGEIAWGGNWFFLVNDHGQELKLENVERLTRYARAVRRALVSAGVTGRDGAEIDHVELFGPAERRDCGSRNFVLCPGGAYDRSPCGTGTSAKMACLFADGKLKAGEVWRQESIIGSVFEGSVKPMEGGQLGGDGRSASGPGASDGAAAARNAPVVLPTIRGGAWVTAEAVLRIDPSDPFRYGIRT